MFTIQIILFRILLDYSYFKWISVYYSYAGFYFDFNNYTSIILSYVLLVSVSLLCPVKQKPSVFIAGLLYMISYVPASAIFAYGGISFQPFVWLSLVFGLLFLLIRKESDLFRGLVVVQTQTPVLVIVATTLFAGFAVLLLKYGIKVPSFTLDVYGTRATYKQSIEETGPFMAYLVSWTGNVLVPFLAVWAIVNKKTALFFGTLIMQLAVFSIAAFKSQFLAIPFVLIILVGIRLGSERLLNYLASVFSVFLMIGCMIDSYYQLPVVNGILSRRFFLLPAQLYYYYFDFFTSNPHTLLSQNLLKEFINYPYTADIPYIIGRKYYGSAEMDANANMWADAFANFGVLGFFVYLFLFWLVLSSIDNLSVGKNKYFVYALLAMPAFSLSNSALLTTMLTHGLLLAALFLCLLPKEVNLAQSGVGGQ